MRTMNEQQRATRAAPVLTCSAAMITMHKCRMSGSRLRSSEAQHANNESCSRENLLSHDVACKMYSMHEECRLRLLCLEHLAAWWLVGQVELLKLCNWQGVVWMRFALEDAVCFGVEWLEEPSRAVNEAHSHAWAAYTRAGSSSSSSSSPLLASRVFSARSTVRHSPVILILILNCSVILPLA